MACDPATLLQEAKCIITCIPPGMIPAASLAALCNLSGGISSLFVLKSGDTMTGALAIVGSADTVQLKVTGFSTQNANIVEFYRDGELSGWTLNNNGSDTQTAYLANTSSGVRHDYRRRGTTGDQTAAMVQQACTAEIKQPDD